MKFWRQVIMALAAMSIATPIAAEPVAEQDRIPLDLRRTTLVVRDAEASLALYRDALGMKVVYDNFIRSPRSATSNDEAERVSRLVFLQANDDFVGILGLLQYLKPEREPTPKDPAFQPGTIVLLFNAKDLDERFESVRATPGVEILSEPSVTTYPSYDGTGTISVKVSVLQDPDGFTIELNQLQEDLKR